MSEAPLIALERGGFRTLSPRVLEFRVRPPEPLLQALAVPQGRHAQGALALPPGEVATLRGEAPADLCERPLRRALRAFGLERSLRPAFDWLACASVAYHDDIHAYAEVMLGVWCLQTPPMDLVLPRPGRRIALQAGSCVVFDPGQPHALFEPGRDDAGQAAGPGGHAGPLTWLVGFHLDLGGPCSRHFGITLRDEPGDARLIGPGHSLVGSATGAWHWL